MGFRLVCGSVALTLAPACSAPEPGVPSDDLSRQVDALFSDMTEKPAPGCAFAVIREGELVLARGYGMADLERGVPIGPDTVFDLGSTSKQFTAACVLLLEQDGELSVDDDVRRWLPELPDYGEPITICDLLHHTSGLRDYLTLFELAGISSQDWTTGADALEMIARQKALSFPPGSAHWYSNSNYFLLSVIVERATGQTLAQFAEARIFGPLKMERTHVHDDHRRLVPGRAIGYAQVGEGTFGLDLSDFEQTGDGSVFSTVEDLARWDANFYDPVVGGQELIDALRVKGKLDDGTEIDYARGLMLGRTGELDFELHGGAWAGYRAQMLRFPAKQLSLICLCNSGDLDPSHFVWRAAALLAGDELGSAPEHEEQEAIEPQGKPSPLPALDAASHAELQGIYESEELGIAYEISARDGGLAVNVRGRGERLPLESEGEDVFMLGGAQLDFARDAEGAVTGFTIAAWDVRDLRFDRR